MEDRNQILLEAQKDLRDEIKMRIKQRDSFFSQAIVFCGALLAFGLSTMKDRIVGSVILCCGPYVALAYWRLLMESYYVHDKIKLHLAKMIERRLDDVVDKDNGYQSWQRACLENGKGVSGRQKNAVTLIMIIGAPIVFWTAILLLIPGIRSADVMHFGTEVGNAILCHKCVALIYIITGLVWTFFVYLSVRSINTKYSKIGHPDWGVWKRGV